jgi:hypothetical protein
MYEAGIGIDPLMPTSAYVNELGYMELDKRGAELLFQVLTEREEKQASPSPPTSPSAKRTCSRELVSGGTEVARVPRRAVVGRLNLVKAGNFRAAGSAGFPLPGIPVRHRNGGLWYWLFRYAE